jgi:HD-like signal output (HDOD) protein
MAKADLDGTAFIETLDKKHILPSLSPVVIALIELATSDESSLGQMADLIMKDPALTAQTLKLANSAFFRSQYPANAALQAVTRIGAYQTRLFALSASLKDAFPLRQEGPLDYGRFWRLCLYQGLLAQWLARTLDAGDPEEAFTAGLMLEIGLLVLVRACTDDAIVYLDYPLPSLLAKEKELYGVNHRQIGEALLRTWRFPERIVACQQSFKFKESQTGQSELARVCAIAGELSAFICGPQADLDEMFDNVEAFFGINKSVAIEAVGAALEHVSEIAEPFDVEIDMGKEAFELMEKANRTLMRLASNVLEQVPAEKLPSPDLPPELTPAPDKDTGTRGGVTHDIRNRLTAVGRFARRLAKTIDPASREGTYVRVIMSEAERLEQALRK